MSPDGLELVLGAVLLCAAGVLLLVRELLHDVVNDQDDQARQDADDHVHSDTSEG